MKPPFFNPKEPQPVTEQDSILVCPVCKSDKPGASVRLLRSVVRRSGRYVPVIDGEVMLCEECGSEWAFCYRSGVFSKRPGRQQYQHSTAEPAGDGQAPIIRLTPKERRSV